MTITAEQAQAELERRARAKSGGGTITPAQAQAELERRRNAAGDEPSLMQQLFDVRNTKTGESYIYGNHPRMTDAQQGAQDFYNIVGDTATRGLADKLAGPEAQARTLASRERMPDIVETPLDIATAVATSPYRVGSTAIGALAGAGEGAVSAYGHQKNWVPDASGAWDIAKGAGEGAVTGGVGAKAGELLGRGWNRMFPEAPVQGPSLPQAEPQLSKVGKVVHSAAEQPLSTTVPIDVALHTLGLPPLASGGAKAAKVAAPLFKPTAPATGPVQPESQAAATLRDYFAKMLAGYGRSQ